MSEGSEEKNIITYETFRKFQRMERENKELQELPGDFYESCNEWIKRKNKAYQKTKNKMILKEIENVMSIIRDILDRRERKLLMAAIKAVRSDAPPKNLLPYEEKHFDAIVEHLKKVREGILEIIKGGEGEKKPKEEKKDEKDEKDKEKYMEEIKEDIKNKSKLKKLEGYRLVKILEDVPQFLGVKEKTYGPLKKDDLVTLEEKVADLLVSKNKAEFAEI